jgi:hypothetical protein
MHVRGLADWLRGSERADPCTDSSAGAMGVTLSRGQPGHETVLAVQAPADGLEVPRPTEAARRDVEGRLISQSQVKRTFSPT